MKQEKTGKKLPGFYVALCCCVIAIGAAGYMLQKNGTESNNAITQDEQNTSSDEYEFSVAANSEPNTVENEITLYTEPPTDNLEAAAIVEEVYDYTYDNPDIEAASVIVNAENSSILSNPIPDVTILDGFSGDTLKYNEIYDDWRSHNGIDISAEKGCSISAAADGTVVSVTESSNGKEVKIEHENGLSTVYAQLDSINVTEGDSIKANSVIGTVGDSIGENVKTPHLHYEIHKDNKPVNPEDY